METPIHMKKIKEEIMIAACKDHEAGMRPPDVCRKYGISQTAFYRYKAKYGGLKLPEVQKIKSEEREDTKLKKKVKEQERVIKALQAALRKKF